MATTNTLSTLLTRLSQRVGDYLSEAVTTALTTNTSVVCTTLGGYVNRDDYYNRYWLYVTDYANSGAYRRVTDYATSTTTLTVSGANFSSDTTNKATFELHKYDRNNKIRAINRAARETRNELFRKVTRYIPANNLLPNTSFDDWTSSSALSFYTATNATLSKATAAYSVRGAYGSEGARVVASAANGGFYISSVSYPELLDLSGQTVTLRVWAFDIAADNDAFVKIVTYDKDGTTQTLQSTTTSKYSNTIPYWTLIELEDQTLNDDLARIDITFGCTTNAYSVVFDNASLIGSKTVHRYMLPDDFQNPMSNINSVKIQVTSISDLPDNDLLTHAQFTQLFNWRIETDNQYRWLVIDEELADNYLIKIEGIAPLESTMSSATDTMTIQDPQLDLLIEYAAYCLFDLEASSPSSMDRQILQAEAMKYLASYNMMKKSLRMPRPQPGIKFMNVNC